MRKILVILAAMALLFPGIIQAQSRPGIDIEVLGVNNTRGEREWRDLIRAEPGQVIEFKADIYNRGQEVARNVQVWVEPGRDGNSPSPTIQVHVRTDNTARAQDSAAVTISMAQQTGNLVVRPRSAVGGLGSGHPINLGNQPVNLGDLPPGPNPMQVSFLADVVVPATPTSRPTSYPTPTDVAITPTPRDRVLGIAATVTPTPTMTPAPKVFPTHTPTPTLVPKGGDLPPKTPDTGFGPWLGMTVISLGSAGYFLRRFSRQIW